MKGIAMEQTNVITSLAYSDETVAIEELFETEYAKEIGIAMQAHQVLLDHQSIYPLTLQVIDGLVKFSSDPACSILHKGDLMTLDAGMKHDLEAIENTLLRLTLFTGAGCDDNGAQMDMIE